MPHLAQFVWGFIGSLATEIPYLSRASQSGHPLPKRYRRPGYWCIRALIAVIAGLISVAADLQHPLIAMHCGAATPLLIDRWLKSPPKAIP